MKPRKTSLLPIARGRGAERIVVVQGEIPHIGESSYMGQAYGRLPPDVAKFLKSGFDECWRVLKPNGTLIFKWGAKDFKLPFVLQTIGRKPLLGNRKPATETYWMVFFKSQDVKNEIPT